MHAVNPNTFQGSGPQNSRAVHAKNTFQASGPWNPWIRPSLRSISAVGDTPLLSVLPRQRVSGHVVAYVVCLRLRNACLRPLYRQLVCEAVLPVAFPQPLHQVLQKQRG